MSNTDTKHPVNDRVEVNNVLDFSEIKALVTKYGLRPVIDAVANAAEMLDKSRLPVKDAYGDPMDSEDIRTATHNLRQRDLY